MTKWSEFTKKALRLNRFDGFTSLSEVKPIQAAPNSFKTKSFRDFASLNRADSSEELFLQTRLNRLSRRLTSLNCYDFYIDF